MSAHNTSVSHPSWQTAAMSVEPVVNPSLAAQQVTGGYSSLPIVQDVDLSLEAGEWLSLVGANGSGKSTLLKLMSRILPLQSGAVWLDGAAIHSQPPQFVARRMALLPQHHPLPEGLTVRQLVSLGRSPHQAWWQLEPSAEDWQQIDAAIAKTQLETLSDRPVHQLSGGERQRAFLALALAQNPTVLLLDEPTTYLDIHYQLQLLDLLRQLNQQGLSIITVLHDVNLAARYSDRIALLKRGTLWAVGTPEQVLTPGHLSQVFGVQVCVLHTPVGLQICPIAPC
ncbi:ABC transporter ATP-binding protein [Leptolyngbya sp. AN02str]|uniref:ABC transporter ATP-binding protein n=1 Tax=Leptolyngbya sp. AN02str TaxID=3423363 RepID=UPI003D31A84E